MTIEDFRPTHVVPQEGLPAWEAPDVTRPTEPLDPLLPVRLVERRGDWGHILCANGWSAWVDGRLLVSVPQEPPAAGQPLARTADPRPLLARVEESLGQYRHAAEDLAAGRADGETFHRRTRGLRVGMVVDGESVWLFDAEHERWVYCDGTRLSTYATPSGAASRSGGPDPRRAAPVEGGDPAWAGGGTPGAPRDTDPARASGPDWDTSEPGAADPAAGEVTRLVEPPGTGPVPGGPPPVQGRPGGSEPGDREPTRRGPPAGSGPGHPPTRHGDG